jgi:hypothetical protein
VKKRLPSKLPSFKDDDEIAAFMKKHSAFDLLDASLADIVPHTPFMIERGQKQTLLEVRAELE